MTCEHFRTGCGDVASIFPVLIPTTVQSVYTSPGDSGITIASSAYRRAYYLKHIFDVTFVVGIIVKVVPLFVVGIIVKVVPLFVVGIIVKVVPLFVVGIIVKVVPLFVVGIIVNVVPLFVVGIIVKVVP